MGGPVSRRDFLANGAKTGTLLLAVGWPPLPPLQELAESPAPPPSGLSASALSAGQRHTLRALWDAVVPGTWNGIVEDRLRSGEPAPGADDARVQDWLEQVSGSLPHPLHWVLDGLLGLWADNVDLWSDVVHWPPFDGKPRYWQLPLSASWLIRGRQRKIILMQSLFGTIVDVQYQIGITLAKLAFYGDFWFESNQPQTRVGRSFIGFPLPPGASPYTDFTYNRVLGDHDGRLITVHAGRDLVALP